jgi:hypothetical protein
MNNQQQAQSESRLNKVKKPTLKKWWFWIIIIPIIIIIYSIISYDSATKQAIIIGSSMFGENIKIIETKVLKISNETGISANKIIKTWASISGILHNTTLEEIVVKNSAMLYQLKFGDMTEIATGFANILQKWDITNISDAEYIMDILFNASKNTSLDLNESINLAFDKGINAVEIKIIEFQR